MAILILLHQITLLSAVRENSLVFRQYWKAQPCSDVNRSEPKKHWLKYLEKSLGIHLNGTVQHMAISSTIRWTKNFTVYDYEICKWAVSEYRLIVTKVCPIENSTLLFEKQIYLIELHKYLKMNLTFLEFHLSDALQCLSNNRETRLEYMLIFHYITKPICDNNKSCNLGYLDSWEILCGHYPAHMRLLLHSFNQLEFMVIPQFNSKLTILFQIISFDVAEYFNVRILIQ